MDQNRRRALRYPFIAEAEVTEIASGVRLRARTNDVSTNGCFLDMLNTSPEGTDVRVKIFHQNGTFTAGGRVVMTFPRLGVGVVFTSVEASQMTLLKEWLSKFETEEK